MRAIVDWLTSDPDDADDRLLNLVRRVGLLLPVLAIVFGGIFYLIRDSADDDSANDEPVVSVDGNVQNSCIIVGENNRCVVEAAEDLTPSQQSWLDAPEFAGPPASWRQVENWPDVAATTFAGRNSFELDPSTQLESGTARLIDGGFSIDFSDTKTVTAFVDYNLGWPGPVEPPYYASITVQQAGGPVDSRACGLLFNGKYFADLSDYADPIDRWFIIKAAGGDVQVTQWTDLNEEGAIDHRRFESFENVIAPDAPAVVEVLVERDRWTAAVNGRVVGSRAMTLGSHHVFPAGQQETTARRGNVVCEFTDWQLWQP